VANSINSHQVFQRIIFSKFPGYFMMNVQRLVIGWLFTAAFASAIRALSNNALNTLPISRMASVIGLFAFVVVYVYATIPGLLAFRGTKTSRRFVYWVSANGARAARKCHRFASGFVAALTGTKHLRGLPVFRFEHFSTALANITGWLNFSFPVARSGTELRLRFPVIQRRGFAFVKNISAKRASLTEFFHCAIPLHQLYHVKI
jgi:hypothetical protein